MAFVSVALVAACGEEPSTKAALDASAESDASGGIGGTEDGGPTTDGPSADGPLPDAASPVPVDLHIPGLSAPVTASTDGAGMLHLRCATDEDCFAAQGYFHAAHRFSQMDINRRFSQGRLSELVGVPTVDTDKNQRATLATQSGLRVEQGLYDGGDADTKALFDGYSRGVNAWIDDLKNARNGARLADEYDFPLIDKTRIDAWDPLHSAACTLLLINDLTNSAGEELATGQLVANLPADLAFDLFGLMPSDPSAVVSNPNPGQPSVARPAWWKLGASTSRLASFRSVLDAAAARYGEYDKDPIGSNNWVVGPSQTANGKALLSNDPHLTLNNPSIWYLIHLDSKSQGGTLNVAGVSFAGLPGVVIGQNEDIAWGLTTTYLDQADVYLETLSPDGEGVMFNGQAVPFVKQVYDFEIHDAAAQTEERLYVPHHGPVLAIDREAGTAVSFRWTGQNASTDGRYLLGLARAKNLAEAKVAISDVTTLGQNFVVVDRQGQIGWFPYNQVPHRPWMSLELAPYLPLPGDGSAEWQGFVPLAELPQAENPADGFLATANNDHTGHLFDGDPTNDGQKAIQQYTSDGFRHGRIMDLLRQGAGQHDLESMLDIVGDVHSRLAEKSLPGMLAALAGGNVVLTPAGEKAQATLQTWDYECRTGLSTSAPDSAPSEDPAARASAVGCLVFHTTFDRLRTRTFADELTAAGLVGQRGHASALVSSFTRLGDLAHAGGYWDDVSTAGTTETSGDCVKGALNDAGAALEEAFGADSAAWLWGRAHTLTLTANLFDQAGVADFNHGPFANDGGMETVDVANPRDPAGMVFEQRAGASVRLTCEAGALAPVSCVLQHPGGQRHDRQSPFYNSMLEKYLRNEPTPLALMPADVEAATLETVTVSP